MIDEFITDEVLRNGKEVDGETFSPIAKLGPRIVNGIQKGKGFNIRYAYDYKSAIEELSSGRYRMTFITCSPGDGIMAKECDKDVDQHVYNFVSCVHEFNMRGGGVFWFLENYPFTYEADLYFKTFYGFEAVGDKDKNIKGGKVMNRVKNETPKAGQFITIGGKATDLFNLSRLDFGIVSIFEGRTLCTLNEKKLMDKGFRVFARESEGNASIMVKEKTAEGKEGRMIIDTAASKLFLEFTEDGTARWISNAAVWLCNTEQFEADRFLDPSVTSGIKMDGIRLPGLKPMEKRIFLSDRPRQTNFCMSIVMDTTGSMYTYLEETKKNIVQILDTLKKVSVEHHLPEGGIVAQVVQYKDYADRMYGETAEYITNDINKLKTKLESFDVDGGNAGMDCEYGWCEDVQGGLIRALEQMKKPPYNTYNHLILVVGDYPNHGDHPDCEITHTLKGDSIDGLWQNIYRDIRSLPRVRVMFMPTGDATITYTMKRMQSVLTSKIVDSTVITSETNYVQVITQTAVDEYKRIIGIS